VFLAESLLENLPTENRTLRLQPKSSVGKLHHTTAINIMRHNSGGTYGGRSDRRGGRGDYYKNKYGGGGRGGRGSSGGGRYNNASNADSENSGHTTNNTPQAYDSNIPRLGGDNGGTHSSFIDLLRHLDQKQYPAYRDIESSTKGWINQMDGYTLYIGKAQSDPYARPTKCRIIVKSETAKFPPVSYQNKVRSVALGDYLNRMFFECCQKMGADVGAGPEGGQGGGGWSGPKGGDIEVS
jgi:hypothetical protein